MMKNRMELQFDASAQNEAFARMVISAFLAKANPTISVVSEIRTAVSEAVTNAVVHAYTDGQDGMIIMRAILDEREVNIEIQDFGCGIEDVAKAMTPFYTSKPEQERTGMGFSLMLSFMDRVQVQSLTGTGTIVKMSKVLGDDDIDVL